MLFRSHLRLDDSSALRAEVLGTEYLGTSRIVTLATAQGATLRAKVGVQSPARRGDQVGLRFDASAVSLFDQASGRALQTARDEVRPAAPRSLNGTRHG